MKRRQLLIGLPTTLILTACGAPQLAHYKDEKPVLDLREYFNGTLDAYGVFTDRAGKVVKRFTVLMQCSWQGDKGLLDEDFSYADGTRQRRVWRLVHEGHGHYSGRADDVLGVARGQSQGNAFNWRYTLALPVDGQTWHVEFDDWMYLMDERVMINKATMSKFGVRLGEVTLTFFRRTKADPTATDQPLSGQRSSPKT